MAHFWNTIMRIILSSVFYTTLAYLVMWETIKIIEAKRKMVVDPCNVAAKRMHAVRSKDLQHLLQLYTFIFRLPFYTTSVRAMPTLRKHNGSSWRPSWSLLRWPNKIKGEEAWNGSSKRFLTLETYKGIIVFLYLREY